MQASIWNVSFRRNSLFTGREDILTQLRDLLQDTHAAALSQPVAMSGLGGIGKTQTAVEYAYRYRDNYQAVCWIRSDTPEELAKDFASLAQLLQLPEREVPEQTYIIAAVKRWLETHTDWLLIFDNADELAIIDDYLPQENKGHILITTRSQVVSGMAEKIELAKMNDGDGVSFLLRRANRTGKITEGEQRAIQEIIKEFEGLPLALDQAGAYLEETGESFSNYLWLYQDQREELLQRRGGYRSDHAPVATTWSLAFQRIEQTNTAAIELIRLCAFLAPDAIPEELITSTAHLLGPTFLSLSNRSGFNDAIAALLKYSLIQRDAITTTLSIHRLVQAVIKNEMKKTQRNQWAARIVHMISNIFPFNEVAPWTQSQRNLPHALIAVEYINHLHFTFAEARDVLCKLGNYFRNRGQYNEAKTLLLRGLSIQEQLLGPDHTETAHSLASLAILYRNQGNYKQAEPLHQRALAIYEQRLGPDHPDTATTLNNLAILYVDQGNYKQAEPLHQRALAIREKILGPDDPDTAQSLNNLALLYSKQGCYAQAKLLGQRALSVKEQCLGPDHPDTAITLNTLADIYQGQNNYEQAEPLYQRAFAIQEQRLGPDHPDTAHSLNDLANLYSEQGHYEQAEPLYQRALVIREKVLGPDHPDTVETRESYTQMKQKAET